MNPASFSSFVNCSSPATACRAGNSPIAGVQRRITSGEARKSMNLAAAIALSPWALRVIALHQ